MFCGWQFLRQVFWRVHQNTWRIRQSFLAKIEQVFVGMFYVYILKSLKSNKRYTGFTNKEPQLRLVEHNSGTNSYTRTNRPFVLLYSESFPSEKEARRRERFLKTGLGRKVLNKLIPP
ncbi:MAG: GIY-YIG nuclease family protein [Candidatus Omnitrophica bacterium]|nr:GIY-YIG nuclease family protein [Candidatus Omnitrophota bacterium]